jgi:hypothetical protein
MPVAEKTIKPIDLGGIAGGDKFITRGILFKVCTTSSRPHDLSALCSLSLSLSLS